MRSLSRPVNYMEPLTFVIVAKQRPGFFRVLQDFVSIWCNDWFHIDYINEIKDTTFY
jgi:hypothetical protein